MLQQIHLAESSGSQGAGRSTIASTSLGRGVQQHSASRYQEENNPPLSSTTPRSALFDGPAQKKSHGKQRKSRQFRADPPPDHLKAKALEFNDVVHGDHKWYHYFVFPSGPSRALPKTVAQRNKNQIEDFLSKLKCLNEEKKIEKVANLTAYLRRTNPLDVKRVQELQQQEKAQAAEKAKERTKKAKEQAKKAKEQKKREKAQFSQGCSPFKYQHVTIQQDDEQNRPMLADPTLRHSGKDHEGASAHHVEGQAQILPASGSHALTDIEEARPSKDDEKQKFTRIVNDLVDDEKSVELERKKRKRKWEALMQVAEGPFTSDVTSGPLRSPTLDNMAQNSWMDVFADLDPSKLPPGFRWEHNKGLSESLGNSRPLSSPDSHLHHSTAPPIPRLSIGNQPQSHSQIHLGPPLPASLAVHQPSPTTDLADNLSQRFAPQRLDISGGEQAAHHNIRRHSMETRKGKKIAIADEHYSQHVVEPHSSNMPPGTQGRNMGGPVDGHQVPKRRRRVDSKNFRILPAELESLSPIEAELFQKQRRNMSNTKSGHKNLLITAFRQRRIDGGETPMVSVKFRPSKKLSFTNERKISLSPLPTMTHHNDTTMTPQ